MKGFVLWSFGSNWGISTEEWQEHTFVFGERLWRQCIDTETSWPLWQDSGRVVERCVLKWDGLGSDSDSCLFGRLSQHSMSCCVCHWGIGLSCRLQIAIQVKLWEQPGHMASVPLLAGVHVFVFLWLITYNRKVAILTIQNVQFSGISYMNNVVQPLSLSLSKTF